MGDISNECKAFYNNFDEETKEILIIRNNHGAGAGKVGGQDFWSVSVDFLAYIDLETNELTEKTGQLTWVLTDEEMKLHSSEYPYFLEKETIYKVLVRKNKYHNSFLIVEVLEKHIQNEKLNSVLEEYKKPVIIVDEVFGELTLDKRFSCLEGEMLWTDSSAEISIDVDIDDKASWDTIINQVKEFCKDTVEVDKKLRVFAASALTELANDWLEDENAVITEEEFAERITLGSITISDDGSYSFYFDDDDIFYGHCVTVYGDLENGLERAEMEG